MNPLRANEIVAAPRRLPRGVNRLPKEVVLKSQRDRLLDAVGPVVAERGYTDTAVSHVIARAGLSRTTFYEIFRDKEACFLAGFERVSRRHLRAVHEAMAPAASLPEQVLAGVRAYLEVLDVDSRLSRAFIVEAESASPATHQAFDRVGYLLQHRTHRWFREVRRKYPEVPDCPKVIFRMLRAGFSGYLMSRIRAGAAPLADETGLIAGFVFSNLGLYRWARLASAGKVPSGPPLD